MDVHLCLPILYFIVPFVQYFEGTVLEILREQLSTVGRAPSYNKAFFIADCHNRITNPKQGGKLTILSLVLHRA